MSSEKFWRAATVVMAWLLDFFVARIFEYASVAELAQLYIYAVMYTSLVRRKLQLFKLPVMLDRGRTARALLPRSARCSSARAAMPCARRASIARWDTRLAPSSSPPHRRPGRPPAPPASRWSLLRVAHGR